MSRSAPPGEAVVPVSVVIPAYNRGETVRRALRSVAAQRPLRPTEVIVIDDCSTDHTGQSARELGARVLRHEENLGEGAARNTGFAAATQPWLATLDSDDEWLPNHLSTLWPLRGQHVLVAGSSFGCTDEGLLETFDGVPGSRPRLLQSPAQLLYPHNFIPVSGVLVRKDVVEHVGGCDTALPFCADLDLWVRVLEQGTGVAVPQVVSRYHLHAGQVSQDKAAMRAAQVAIVEAYSGRPWWSPSLMEHAEAVGAWDALREELGHREFGGVARHARSLMRPRRATALAPLWWRRLQGRRRVKRAQRLSDP